MQRHLWNLRKAVFGSIGDALFPNGFGTGIARCAIINPGMEQKKPTKPPLPDCHQGQEAAQRFGTTMAKLLTVPRATLIERENTYRKQVDANPNRRGPKRKILQGALSKLQADKQDIDSKLLEVQGELSKRQKQQDP